MPIFREKATFILSTFYPWRRRILLVTLMVFVLSTLLSLLKTNYYQAKTIFYVASQDLFKPEKVFGNTQKETFYFGGHEDIDHVLTIGNSDDVIDFLIDSFDLWHVYKIRSGNPKAHFNLRKALRENYKILLTKQDAIELTVEDVDPNRAADMTNAARDRIDVLVRSVIKNSQLEIASSYKRSIINKEAIMQSTLDSLVYHRRMSGIYDPKRQTEILSRRATELTNNIEREKAVLEALQNMPNLSKKLTDTIKLIQVQIVGLQREQTLLNSPDTGVLYSLTNFNLAKGKVEELESRYSRSYDRISYDLEKLKTYNAAVDIQVSSLYLIESAQAPNYKNRPNRLFIVIVCTVTSFLFSLGAILVINSYKDVNWQDLTTQVKRFTPN